MKRYELSLNFLKNNFNYKNFCEDLNFAYEKNHKDYPIDEIILHHSIFDKVGKFNTIQEVDEIKEDEKDWSENSDKISKDFLHTTLFISFVPSDFALGNNVTPP